MSRKSATIFGQGAIPEPSTPHIGREVALVARTAAFVYIYARISQIAEIRTSFYATKSKSRRQLPRCAPHTQPLVPRSISLRRVRRGTAGIILRVESSQR